MIETAYYRGKCDGLLLIADLIDPDGTMAKRLFAAYVEDISALTEALDSEREQNAVSVSETILEMMSPVSSLLTQEFAPQPFPLSTTEESPVYSVEPLSVLPSPPSGTETPQEMPTPSVVSPAPCPVSPVADTKPQLPPATKQCVICGEEFSRPNGMTNHSWIAKKTCSRACQSELQSRAAKKRFAKNSDAAPVPESAPQPLPVEHGGIEEARAYIQQCILDKQPIDQRRVSGLTGYSHGELRQFIQQAQDATKPVKTLSPKTISEQQLRGLARLAEAIHGGDDEEPDAAELDEIGDDL